MTVYREDLFERSGGLGGDWIYASLWDISNGRARYTYGSAAGTTIPTNTPSHDYQCTVGLSSASHWAAGEAVYVSARNNFQYDYGFRCLLTVGTGGNGGMKLQKIVNGTITDLTALVPFDVVSGDHTLTLRVVGNVLTGYYDGLQRAQITDSTFQTYDYGGMGFTNQSGGVWLFDYFRAESVSTATFGISPTTVPTDGVAIPLTLTGSGTAWTPGVPGSPTFTVSAGTITAQLVLAADLAAITYNAPATEQTVTFGDPSTLASAAVEVADTAPWWMPGGGDLFGLFAALQRMNDALTTLLNDSADALFDAEELDPGESVLSWVRFLGTPPEGETISSLLVTVLDELQNDHDDPTTIRSVVNDLLTALYVLTGEPTPHSIQDVLDAIAEVGAPDLSAITEAISGVSDQVTDVATTLGTLAGTPVTTMAELLAAVGAVGVDAGNGAADALAAKNKLDALTGSGTYNLEGTDAAIGGVGLLATVGIIVGIIGLVRGTGATIIQTVETVTDIVADKANLADVAGHLLNFLSLWEVPSPTDLTTDVSGVLTAVNGVHDDLAADLPVITDAIDGAVTDLGSQISALSDKIDALSEDLAALQAGAPIWPGLANVTLGEPVALDTATEIEGPMDGVLLDITSTERLMPALGMGTFYTYRTLGRFAFVTDNGYMERWSGIPNQKAILTPLSMRQADKLYISCYTGVTGTATPYLVNAT